MTNDCVVKISDGLLEGEKVQNEFGGSYFSFKGIPFAEPPVGNLRFQAPQPPQPWNGVRSAKEFGPINYQIDLFTMNPPEGSEDCLYLNVYTPDLKPKEPFPVMVWIHGGAFIWGSGNDDVYGPEFLIRENVILVTFNYRLAIFGFFCLDTKDAPGNAGMKDQVAALRWVKNNIKNFGGDPANVTIFGESAGAGSVGYHLISPMSKGLFKRAILQSGAASFHWTQAFEPQDRAKAVAKKLGFESDDLKQLYEFFKSAPMESLIAQSVPLTYRETGSWNANGFLLTSEKDFGQERFFYGNVYDAVKNGAHEGVEVMMGYVKDESVVLFRTLEDLDRHIENLNNFLETLVPMPLCTVLPIKEQLEIGRKMRKFYFDNKTVTRHDWEKIYEHMMCDFFLYDMLFTLKNLVKDKAHKSFFYKLTCNSERNFFKDIFLEKESKLPVKDKADVVSHGDCMAYLFPIKFYGQKVNVDSKEFKYINRATKLWTNFATHGNPTPDDQFDVTWDPYCLEQQRYMEIGEKLIPRSKPDNEQVKFWEEIYSQYMYKK